MGTTLALLALLLLAGGVVWAWHALRKFGARKDAQAERAASLIAEVNKNRKAVPAPAPAARAPAAPPDWEALGRSLLAKGAFLEAAWTLHAAAALAGDAMSAQKRLVEIAARAAAAGRPQAALLLYGTLLEKYPESEYAGFVRSSMKAEEKKLGKV